MINSLYREDFPNRDVKNWLRSVIVKNVDGRSRLGTIVLHRTWQNKGDEKFKHWA